MQRRYWTRSHPVQFLCYIHLCFQKYRESIYQLLSQTTPENTSKNYAAYSIDPKTRYQRVNFSSIHSNQVRVVYLLNRDLNGCHQDPLQGDQGRLEQEEL